MADRGLQEISVREGTSWRVPEEFIEEAWQDATLLAIRAQEAAGIDIIIDGEVRRESYSNRFATALDGVDLENHGEALIAAAIRIRCRASLA